jgi:hypothetical protein
MAMTCWALMYVAAFTSWRLPLQEGLKEDLILGILWPVQMMSALVMGAVDRLGPQGRAEPASMYLPTWAVGSLFALSNVLLIAALFAVTYTIVRNPGLGRFRMRSSK